jgi:calcineurin-like phosphoesterase family protein
MKTWLTSDLHLFHRNIITYCSRPFKDEYEMNDFIIEMWNKTVGETDRVIVVGDLTAGLDKRNDELSQVISRLKGVKTLVLGNHDHMTAKWYKTAGFDTVVRHIYDNGVLFVHKPATEFNVKSINLQNQYKPNLIIHGHIHSDLPEIDGHYNVAWDRHCQLIDYDEIINLRSLAINKEEKSID